MEAAGAAGATRTKSNPQTSDSTVAESTPTGTQVTLNSEPWRSGFSGTDHAILHQAWRGRKFGADPRIQGRIAILLKNLTRQGLK